MLAPSLEALLLSYPSIEYVAGGECAPRSWDLGIFVPRSDGVAR